MDNEYLDIIGLGIFKALNDKRYPILVNGKISESAIPTSITNSITSILSLIPDAASSENKLADKNFVNSSIATNTATFRGTFDDLATLQSTSADINDYAFYVHTDEIGNTAYDRYKHNGSTWVFEYTLNNSSFTAEQWSAINSGITTTKVGNYDAHLINYSNPHKVTKSQVGLGNVENVALSSWAGSNKITTLGTITTGVWNGTKITNTYLANSSITIGTTAINLGSTAKSLAGIEKLQLNDANSNLVYDSTTGSWKLTGNLLVTGFISAGAKGNSSSGGGSTYTQREWAEIKIMSASEIGLLASAYSVKEAYNELNTAIETLAGKATNVKFTQTLTSGKQIGSISIDGKSTSLFAPANYAWSEVTGKPSFATVATSGSYTDLTNKPTIASLMGSTAIGGTSSYLYWNGSAWATKALGSNAFTSISKVSQLTNDSGYITGITKSMVEGVLTGNITSHTHSYLPLSGGTMSNTNVVTNLNADLLDGYNASSFAKVASHNNLMSSSNEFTFASSAYAGEIFINYRTAGGFNGAITKYSFCNGAGGLLASISKGQFSGNAVSASKWENARTITLTGSVTGSVSIDGSQNVSLATTTNHTHSYLPLTGGTVTGPLTINTVLDRSFILDEPGGEKYHVISFRASGEEYAYLVADNIGSENKLVFNGSTILHSGNYNSYSPKLDGTGASGTWGINISGNAATADTLAKTFAENINYAAYTTGLKLIRYDNNWEANGFPEKWTSGLSVMSGYCGWQLVTYGGSSDTPYFRKVSDSGVWSNWRALAFTDSNVASATKLANSRTLWGQSFNGTGDVSGALSGVTNINKVLHINSSGNVTIGSADKAGTSAKLYVGGKIRTQYINLENGNEINCFLDNGDSAPLCLNYDSSGNIILGFGGGNVGIGGISSPSYKLHIAGVAYASEGLVSDGYISSAATSTSSDIRLKDNISEIGSKTALNWLLMLKPKSWTWNDKAGIKGQSMGFVAQDVEGILPQMIRKRRDNGYLSLDYTQLHALEVSALQSHEKRIEELERENKILKEELNKLKLNAN